MLKRGVVSLIFFGSLLLFLTNYQNVSFTNKYESQQALIADDAFDIDILVQKKKGAQIYQHEIVLDATLDEQLLTIIQKATRINGIVDMAPHDYEITVIKNDSVDKIYYLWINNNTKRANVMDNSDTYTAYYLSSESTEQLKQILINRGLPPS